MARVLDLNSVELTTLDLTLQDVDRTRVRVCIPTEGLVQELEQLTPKMKAIMQSGDREGVALVFDLAARLISCNRENKTITAEELRGKYQMSLESAIVFYSAYLDFISEITNQKN